MGIHFVCGDAVYCIAMGANDMVGVSHDGPKKMKMFRYGGEGFVFNPDFPLALVARLNKRLKMCEKKQKLCGRRSHTTLTNNF